MLKLEITSKNINSFDDEVVTSLDITPEIISDIKKSFIQKLIVGSELIKLKNTPMHFNASKFAPFGGYVFSGLKYRTLAVHDSDNNIIYILDNVVFCGARNKETGAMELNESSIVIIEEMMVSDPKLTDQM